MPAPILPSTPTASHGLDATASTIVPTPNIQDEHAVLPRPSATVRPFFALALGGAVLLGLAGILTGCAPAAATPPSRLALDEPTWTDSLAAWRTQRLSEIAGADGWSTVTGLVWLDEREQWTIGTGSTAHVRLVRGHVPADVGSVQVTGRVVRFRAAPAAPVIRLVRAPAANAPQRLPVDSLTLNDDKQPEPTVLTVGSVTLRLIERSGRLALRVKDSLADARVHFAGLDYFANDSALRVPARLLPGAPGDSVAIINILGQTEQFFSPGRLQFTIGGAAHSLRAVREPSDTTRLFILFRDHTSADATYPAGRFIYAVVPGVDGWTVLDFNRAFNPPCAFTAFATCPLPPRENQLKLRIEAGERRYAGRHPVSVAER